MLLTIDDTIVAGEPVRERTQVYVPIEYPTKKITANENPYLGTSVNPYRRDALEQLQWPSDQASEPVKRSPTIMHIDPS